MRTLFVMDLKDYDPNGKVLIRPSARALIIRHGKIAMIHSQRYGYYKFPGGGIEKGESAPDALIREVREEAGLKRIVLSQLCQCSCYRFDSTRKLTEQS